MAQLDPLIAALVQHSGEAIVLKPGEQPALVVGGTPRPVLRTPLDAAQLRRLVAEVAPDPERSPLAAGRPTTFTYAAGETRVQVEVAADGGVVIRRQASSSTGPAAGAARVEGAQMDGLLRTLVERGGSDLHLSSGCRPLLRIDGDLTPLGELPELDAAAVALLLVAIAPERNRQEFAERGDTDFAYEIDGLARFRCNFFRDRNGAGGVFRVIPSRIVSADELGLSAEVQGLTQLTKGLVLVTGPTGSGKSTTLAGLIDLVNATRADHVITIEDPIEFVHPNKRCLINQREIHAHTASFKAALRAALREDPDIVLVGELRDLETVAIALETAETGHLVFATMHTNSAVSTVDRIVDQFPGEDQERIRILLSEALKAVISQVLCRKIGGGRVAAHEVLIVNAAVSNLIREGKSFQIPSIMQTSRKLGNITMTDALVELVRSKRVEAKEAYLRAVDKSGMASALRSKNLAVDFLPAPAEPRTREPA